MSDGHSAATTSVRSANPVKYASRGCTMSLRLSASSTRPLPVTSTAYVSWPERSVFLSVADYLLTVSVVVLFGLS